MIRAVTDVDPDAKPGEPPGHLVLVDVRAAHPEPEVVQDLGPALSVSQITIFSISVMVTVSGLRS